MTKIFCLFSNNYDKIFSIFGNKYFECWKFILSYIFFAYCLSKIFLFQIISKVNGINFWEITIFVTYETSDASNNVYFTVAKNQIKMWHLFLLLIGPIRYISFISCCPWVFSFKQLVITCCNATLVYIDT